MKLDANMKHPSPNVMYLHPYLDGIWDPIECTYMVDVSSSNMDLGTNLKEQYHVDVLPHSLQFNLQPVPPSPPSGMCV